MPSKLQMSTCREFVVDYGQHVKVELDMLSPLYHSRQKSIYEKTNNGASIQWLTGNTFLYHCPEREVNSASFDSFMILVGDYFDIFRISIGDKYRRSVKDQEANYNVNTLPQTHVAQSTLDKINGNWPGLVAKLIS